jgi:phage recombination protein Bet
MTTEVTTGVHAFTPEQVALIKSQITPEGTTDDELAMFLLYCTRTGLDPWARQIYLSERRTKKGDRWITTRKPETTIDGFRLIADRTTKYAGQLGPQWCGEDGAWKDVWTPREPPIAARVGVLRHDFKEPLYAVALYDEYVQKNSEGRPNSMWLKMPANQLAKCSESLALRRAFPRELSGLYTREEMAQDTPDSPAPSTEQYFVEEIPADSEPVVQVVDHINGNPTDNTLSNLKIVPQSAKPEPTLNEQVDAHRALAEIEVKQIREDIIKTTGGVTKQMTDEFFLGWFGAKDKRSLPRIVSSYLAPLQALQKTLVTVAGSHQQLLESPQALGASVKKEYDQVTAGGTRNHAAQTTEAVFERTEVLDDKDILEDPLLTKFNWKNINTAIFAKALMVKWGHDMETFEKHLRLLKILDLPEPEIVALCKMLWHSTDAYTIWKRGLDKKIPLTVSLIAIENELGETLGNGSDSAKVAKAISVVAGAM